MKNLSIERMEKIEAGGDCGNAGNWMTLAGAAATFALLTMAAPATGGLSLAYGLGLAVSLTSTVTGAGCAANDLVNG